MRLGQAQQTRLGPRVRIAGSLLLVVVLAVGLLSWEWGWHGSDGFRLFQRPLDVLSERSAREPATLTVDMGYVEYDQILRQHERAQRDGVWVSSEQDFVSATMHAGRETIPVDMRLMPSAAQHAVPGTGLSYQVRTENDAHVLGLRRFYLQELDEDGWLDRWAFSQALEQAGVLVARYELVRLVFNGEGMGAYVLHEGFAAELLEAQGRSEGVIIRFDVGLIEQAASRFGGIGAAQADPVANLSVGNPQCLDIEAVCHDADRDCRDPQVKAQREHAAALLFDLQTGQQAASEVLNVEQYGALLALADLWGATEVTALANLGFYYDATHHELQPIAFDMHVLDPIARQSLTATYGDPWVQQAYVQHALRLSQPAYVDQLQSALEDEWQALAYALRFWARDAVAPWEKLRERQEYLRQSLDPAQPVLAHLRPESPDNYGVLEVHVANVLNLPVEIVGFDVGGTTFVLVDPGWIEPSTASPLLRDMQGTVLRAVDRAQLPVLEYVQFHIPLTAVRAADQEARFDGQPDIWVATRLASASATAMTPVRWDLSEGRAE